MRSYYNLAVAAGDVMIIADKTLARAVEIGAAGFGLAIGRGFALNAA